MTAIDPPPSLIEALVQHRAGNLADAERLYRATLRDFPRCADAYHLLAMLAHHTGRSEEARDLLLRAIGNNPNDPAYHSNLGTILCALRQFDTAAKAFSAALALQPDLVEAHANLALALLLQGRPDAAIESCRRTLQLRPDCVEAHLAWADALLALGDPAQAAEHYRQAIQLAPDLIDRYRRLVETYAARNQMDQALAAAETLVRLATEDADAHRRLAILLHKNRQSAPALAAFRRSLELSPDAPDTHLNFAATLQETGDSAAALLHYRHALALRPDWPEAKLGLATLTGENTPPASDPESVRRLFDQYAPTYDQHMLHSLHYKAAAELLAAFQKIRPAATNLAILDLGCGTGLAGQAFKSLAGRLAGIDLSPAMIDHARARRIYDELLIGNITQLPPHFAAQFDLLLAADVLLYLGDLAPAFAAAQSALRPAGLFAFTIESTPEPNYRLNLSSRYTHNPAYVENTARAQGLTLLHQSPITLREEKNAPVPGHVLIVQHHIP